MTVALQLGWQPKTVPTDGKSPPSAGPRRDFALEIRGDSPDVKNGAEGTVKIVEAKGKGDAAAERLIATFHGTWHRSGKGSRAVLTFEIFVPKAYPASGWERRGYDPECIPGLGVDGFTLTFVGVVFPVNFPFFIDASTEGRFLELQAIAAWNTPNSTKEIASSPVLTIPIRRHRTVESTTQKPPKEGAPPSGSGVEPEKQTYTDDLVGNLILHHESFLVGAARVKKGREWPKEMSAERIPISPSQPGAFAAYSTLPDDRKLRIFVDPALIEDLLPDASDSVWTAKLLASLRGPALRPDFVALSRRAITDKLIELFEADSGFAGARVSFLKDPGVPAAFAGSGPFTIPFFTFLVQQNNGLDEVACAERMEYPPPPIAFDGYEWRVPSPFPLGSGDKTIRRGIQFQSSYFGERFARFVTEPRQKGVPPLTIAEVRSAVQKQAEKVAEVIAHEIGHSLGLMHESEIAPDGTCSEFGVGPLRSIMCSKTESDPYGVGVKFSNQAKLIWRTCFGVKSQLPTYSLQNKTWKDDEWRTIDWDARIQLFMHAIGETSLTRYLNDNNNVSPYKKMPQPQPGTYVAPPGSSP